MTRTDNRFHSCCADLVSQAARRASGGLLLSLIALCLVASVTRAEPPKPETRGTWLTTTANDAIANPEKTAETMRRLREIGINTVYVECWKNGYTQYPSEVLQRTIGVDRRPGLMPQDPSDSKDKAALPARDLVEETLIEAHRNGLIYIAWFEYGFMAAHKDTDNHLRRMKPEWLSKDIKGNTVAPNGFVWMNPLHPDARRFLTDLVLEAVDKYDLDGIQLDDRIVWPHVSMGYDDFTRAAYAKEHDGREPPADASNPEWIRWRADKVTQYAKQFVEEVRAKRPGLLISLSPAPYPWCYDHYCLEWPKWAAPGWAAAGWDEFIPQNYRFSFDAFKSTWDEQITHWKGMAGDRPLADLMPGIRIVGDGKDSTWDQLRRSIQLARESGSSGHVLWFSRGVLDVYPKELTEFYNVATVGSAAHPKFPADWRQVSTPAHHFQKDIVVGGMPDPRTGKPSTTARRALHIWSIPAGFPEPYTVIARFGGRWKVINPRPHAAAPDGTREILSHFEGEAENPEAVELLADRKPAMGRPRAR